MYDSIESTPTELPDGADLYAGYDDGAWPDAGAIAARFPGKTVIRTTTNPADEEGDELDVENGDASATDAPGWVARRRAAGHRGPLVYCALSSWPDVRRAFIAARVAEPGYRVASYDGVAEIPAGAIGKQYASVTAGGRNYDVSVMVDHLPGIDPDPLPVPIPYPLQEDSMELVVDAAGNAHIVGIGAKNPTGQAATTRAGHPLYFIVKPTGATSAIDVTDEVLKVAPGDKPYLVAS